MSRNGTKTPSGWSQRGWPRSEMSGAGSFAQGCTVLEGPTMARPRRDPQRHWHAFPRQRDRWVRVIGARVCPTCASKSHAKRVVGSQVGRCIQVIGCRVAPSLPPSCIMQEGCSRLMQGGHGGILAAHLKQQSASPSPAGSLDPSNQTVCSSDMCVAGCQAGNCIQVIGCRAMEVAPLRSERSYVFCTGCTVLEGSLPLRPGAQNGILGVVPHLLRC